MEKEETTLLSLIMRNPATSAPPTGMYSHGIEVPPQARWLYITGQVGIDVEGRTAATIDEQCRLAWWNIEQVLASAGMAIGDLVRVNAYLIDPRHIEPYRVARDSILGDARPASTVLVVSMLADPGFWVEIEAVAAKI